MVGGGWTPLYEIFALERWDIDPKEKRGTDIWTKGRGYAAGGNAFQYDYYSAEWRI